jgi:hypothetical protein
MYNMHLKSGHYVVGHPTYGEQCLPIKLFPDEGVTEQVSKTIKLLFKIDMAGRPRRFYHKCKYYFESPFLSYIPW